MQQAWNALLDFLSSFVSPDWASVIGMLPVLVAALAGAFVAGLVIAYLILAGPTRRGRRRLPALPPPGVHEGEPSLAPLFVAIGAAVLFFGVVFRGPVLAAGILLTVAGLLYWGREAIRDYNKLDRHELAVDAGATALRPLDSLAGVRLPRIAPPAAPAAAGTSASGDGAIADGASADGATAAPSVHGLPAGLHAPVPSFRPLLVSAAAAVLFFGLVFGPIILTAGVVLLFITLVGWLADARVEYRATVRADQTGHLEPLPAPGIPVGTFVLFAAVLAIAITARIGLFPGSSSGAAPQAPAAGASAGAAASGPASGTLAVVAHNIAFDVQALTAPANKGFTIKFDNQDSGVPHNIVIHKDSASGQAVFTGSNLIGPGTASYTVPALAPGTYAFICSIHPTTMHGTLTVR